MIEMNNGQVRLHQGDSRDVLRGLGDCSIDSIVCDPPYALVSIQKRFGKAGSAPAQHGKDGLYARASRGFMGKDWDVADTAFAETFWAECLRVLKPGGHVVAFGGTRTYHRLVCAIEDAGFEIRDQIGWAFGSGFPKSHNQKGEWEGWGTALKPAWEPICLARRPLSGTVAGNLAEWGVGALNVDGCRVDAPEGKTAGGRGASNGVVGWQPSAGFDIHDGRGRWPANIIHDGSDEVLAAFPETAPSKAASRGELADMRGNKFNAASDTIAGSNTVRGHTDNGGSAARFFYAAKASRKDRDEGLDGFAIKDAAAMAGNLVSGQPLAGDGTPIATPKRANTHPTVKPTSLMAYLCRLITPPGGTILDPFMGSGSTGKAAVLEGFNFVGIEREDEYMPIAEARIAWAVLRKAGGVVDHEPVIAAAAAEQQPPANDNGDLFAPTQAGAA